MTQFIQKQVIPASAPAFQSDNLQAILGLALRLHDEGHFQQAEAIYRQILVANPLRADVTHLLGVLEHQKGDDAQAIELLERAVALDSGKADFYRALGEVYRALRRFDEAITSFGAALSLEPEDVDSIVNMGSAHLQTGAFGDAEACYRDALRAQGDDPQIHCYLGVALMYQHRTEEAISAYRDALELDPEYAEAKHMLAAISGDTPASAPREYVAELFDRYADTFDTHLCESLHYRAPQQMRAAVDEVSDTTWTDLKVLDLGCGTGLCGEAFRDLAQTLIGVDVSPKMIDRAQAATIYDETAVADAVEALEQCAGALDLVLAADVFIYVGALETLFARANEALKPGGRMAFSTESIDGDGYALRATGRFAHGERYIRNLASTHGFIVERCDEIVVRSEQGAPVTGQLFVLRTA